MHNLEKFVLRERLYIGLVVFIILTHFLLSSVNNFLEESSISKIFDKELPVGGSGTFDQNIMDTISANPVANSAFLILLLFFLMFILAGIVTDAIFLYKKANGSDPIVVTQPVAKAGWGFWDICRVIIIFFFAESAASLAMIGMAFVFPDFSLDHNIQLALMATALDAVVIAAVFYFVIVKVRQSANSLGLTFKNMLLNVKYGVTAYIGLIPVFFVVTIVTAAIFKVLDVPVEPQDVVEIFKEEKNVPSLIYLSIFTSFLGPVMEEIFFRGFVYGAFRNKIGIGGGILASAAFFAYVHANAAGFMPILSLGILLAYIYEKTGSLVSAITAHILHNSAMLIFLFFLKAIAAF